MEPLAVASIAKTVGIIVGLISISTILWRFSALQTTQTKCIEDLKDEVDQLKKMKKPSEVCAMKIDMAVEKAHEAEQKVKDQTNYNIKTERKMSNLDGKVTEGFKQMAAGMAIIQNAFLDIKTGG